MPKKIALDYDDSELRIVVANCSGSRVQVSDAQVIPIGESESVSEKLRAYINAEGLQKTETLVAIGRGRAELRELQLPPVPDDELPDMVRFQAMRSFASAGERASIDFLVTHRTSENKTLIAAAVSPVALDGIRELCATSDLLPKRVALRPLAAASLYLRTSKPPQICAMIDLLADDAEIVIARGGKVIFVRTVRLPSGDGQRSNAIASELRRTMMACGETSTPDRIVVWGTEAVHTGDIAAIRETIGCEDVRAVNPFDLVKLQMKADALPEHVGRLAPLVGLLATDETAPETLIDFLNPRQAVEEEPDRVRRLLMIALPVAAVFLMGFFVYRKLGGWDRKIAAMTDEVNMLLPTADAADLSMVRTEKVDVFLDADVNWLDEIRRLAAEAPASDRMIVRSVTGTANTRAGGGTLRVVGAVTDPGVIDEMESSLRDELHGVVGKGTQAQKGSDVYGWTYTETLTVTGSDMRNTRYTRMSERQADGAAVDVDAVGATGTEPDADPAEGSEASADGGLSEGESSDSEGTSEPAGQSESPAAGGMPEEETDPGVEDAPTQESGETEPTNEKSDKSLEVQA